MFRKGIVLIGAVAAYVLLFVNAGTAAQHHRPTPAQPTTPAQQHPTPTLPAQGPDTAATQSMQMPSIRTTVGMIGSGTSIEPMSTIDNAPPMLHRTLKDWDLMFHSNVFVLDVQQTGPRGADKFVSANWFMPMLMRQRGAHTFLFRSMFSLEPLTVTKRRYPQLFQTGETAFGLPIVDGQHPHDLFMEIAGMYRFQRRERTQFFVYGGPRGEPAIGPTAFPHRSSASENPIAVLGHHQQDSTHIADSVITLGLAQGPMQLEASTFRGREPNEGRWNIDGGAPNSFASRISLSAGDNWTGQFSAGRINNREELDPDLDTFRMTASLHHNLPMARGHWSSSLIWGRNKDLDVTPRIFNAYTLESTLRFVDGNWVWGRIENVDRDRTILFWRDTGGGRYRRNPDRQGSRIHARLWPGISGVAHWLKPSLGFQLTVYGLPDHLKPIYGDRPAGFVAFLRFRPGRSMQSAQMRH